MIHQIIHFIYIIKILSTTISHTLLRQTILRVFINKLSQPLLIFYSYTVSEETLIIYHMRYGICTHKSVKSQGACLRFELVILL
uniref:Uncharacterized protein n=1 Tax=Pararge aegeria TaxID=116150 RepID=S4PWV9_9NEOP